MWSQFFHCLADMHHSFILLQIFRFNITFGQLGSQCFCCERKRIDKI